MITQEQVKGAEILKEKAKSILEPGAIRALEGVIDLMQYEVDINNGKA